MKKDTLAGSFNQGAATASSEPILKAAHLIAIFKRKVAVVSLKHERNTRDSLAAGECFPCVSGSPLPFFF